MFIEGGQAREVELGVEEGLESGGEVVGVVVGVVVVVVVVVGVLVVAVGHGGCLGWVVGSGGGVALGLVVDDDLLRRIRWQVRVGGMCVVCWGEKRQERSYPL